MNNIVWTIIIGIIVGVSANMLTPTILKLLGNLFYSIEISNKRKEEIFENSVQYILDNPDIEIIIRIEKNGYYSRAFIMVSISLLLAILFPSSLPSTFINLLRLFFEVILIIGSLTSFYIGFNYWMKARKLSRIASETWRRRREMQHNIDLD